MKNSTRWAIRLALFIAAFVAFGNGVASAQESSADVAAPVDICGIQVGILGGGSADCGSATAPAPAPAAEPVGEAAPAGDPATSSGDSALIDDVDADVAAPINVCGIGVAVDGSTPADCSTANASEDASASEPEASSDDSTLIGDVDADVAAPIDVCGIGVGVAGSTGSDCAGRAATPVDDGSDTSTGTDDAPSSIVPSLPVPGLELLNSVLPAAPLGDDVDADVAAPIGVCGVGVGVAGSTSSDCSSVLSESVVIPDDDTPVAEVPLDLPEAPVGQDGIPVISGLVPVVTGALGGLGGLGSSGSSLGLLTDTATDSGLFTGISGITGQTGLASAASSLLPSTGGSTGPVALVALLLLYLGLALRMIPIK